ncbi:hypothetical protein QZH41_006441, partial [Actinostola sp. cb2023]
DVFQKKVDETFGDLTGVTGIADDIVVVGFKEDGSDHDTNLQAVMERARSTGLKFNPDKCVIKSTSIPFYGHILSANGLKVDPSKIIFGRPLRDSLAFVNRLEKYTNPNIRPLWRHAWAAKEDALRARITRTTESLKAHSRALRPLSIGEQVFLQNPKAPTQPSGTDREWSWNHPFTTSTV